MPEHQTVQRWRHPAALIYSLGGLLGFFLNMGTTFILVGYLSWNPFAAFFAGTFMNQLFHYVYYNVVYVNHEIRLRTSLGLHFLLSVAVSTGASGLLWFFLSSLGWNLLPGFFACMVLLSLANTLLNRVSTFSSARMAQVEYREMNESFTTTRRTKPKSANSGLGTIVPVMNA